MPDLAAYQTVVHAELWTHCSGRRVHTYAYRRPRTAAKNACTDCYLNLVQSAPKLTTSHRTCALHRGIAASSFRGLLLPNPRHNNLFITACRPTAWVTTVCKLLSACCMYTSGRPQISDTVDDAEHHITLIQTYASRQGI